MPTLTKLTLRNRFSAAMSILMMACATTPLSSPVDGVGLISRTILQVTNNNFDDVQLLLMRSGTAIQIGAVPGLSTRVFEITGSQLGDGGELQLLAGSRSNPSAHRSSVFAAAFGQRIAWVIDYRVPSDVVIVR